jgi:hypothetical protein
MRLVFVLLHRLLSRDDSVFCYTIIYMYGCNSLQYVGRSFILCLTLGPLFILPWTFFYLFLLCFVHK